ncbi:D-tyrosyl-tRNA(Tyr) deacylase [bacterium]|nr:D-tyrosyl-tRNA(Tyr) deacylase [bacterium]
MRVIIQRVSHASVAIDGHVFSQIGTGLLVLLGIGIGDTLADATYLFDKLTTLRIFPDEKGRFDRSIVDISGELLVVSQFTLFANCSKGRRPSFEMAAPPAEAEALYNDIIADWQRQIPNLATGQFGADMAVSLTNSGPVTLTLDSKNR